MKSVSFILESGNRTFINLSNTLMVRLDIEKLTITFVMTNGCINEAKMKTLEQLIKIYDEIAVNSIKA